MEVHMKKLFLVLSMVFVIATLTLVAAVPALAAGPNAAVHITAIPNMVPAGGSTALIISEENTGDVPLDFVAIYLYAEDNHIYTLQKGSYGWFGGDFNRNNVLDTNETWYWVVRTTVDTDTIFHAYGDCEYEGAGIYAPDYPTQADTVEVNVYHCGWWYFFWNWLHGWFR
jgi:hypothetical protein